MVPVYIRGVLLEYLNQFGRGDTTKNVEVILHAYSEVDPDPLYQRALDRGEPLSDQEIIDEYLGGNRETFEKIMKWFD